MKRTSLILIAVAAFGASAAQVDSPAPPTSPLSAMFSLEDIYNRLNAGTAGAKRTGGFTDPTTGPLATRHTLNDVMSVAPANDNVNAATASQVLAGKTYWSLQGGAWGTRTGTVPAGANVTGANGSLSVTVPNGLYSGSTTATAADTNLVTGNIKSGTSIFGVAGSTSVVDTSAGTAVAGNILSGKTAYVSGSLVTGTVSAGTNVTGTNGSLVVTVPNGLFSGSTTATAADTNLVAANIKSGTSIFGVSGTALVATGNATAANVLSGQTFSNSTTAGVTGTMPNNGAVTLTPGTTAQTIAAGFHNGSGTVSGDANLLPANIKSGVSIFGVAGKTSVVETSTGTAGAGDINTGKVAFVNGTQLTGTGLIATGNAGANDVSIGKSFSNAATVGATGTRPTAPVARSGQTVSYAAGDDGANPKGVTNPSPRFTDNGNGTVTDNLTGLIWLKNALSFSTWANALSYCNTLASGSAGLTDGSTAGQWRLPNVKELQSLIDFSNEGPAFPTGHPFTGNLLNFCWSSNTLLLNTQDAWGLDLNYGGASWAAKTQAELVWPVRGGQ